MFKKILVPIDVDYPKTATAVCQKASAIAGANNGEVRLVGVMPGFGMPIVASYVSDEIRNKAAEEFKASMENFIKNNCTETVTYTIRTGKHWEEIIKAGDKWGADLIIVYHNHRRDINEAFSGSCARRVSEHANCSVLRLRQILA